MYMGFRKYCLIMLLAVVAGLLYVPSAEAGWFRDFLFPVSSNQPNPAETLKAPFANNDAVIEELDTTGRAENRTPLHLRHRTNDIITRWVQHNIPNMLSYEAVRYNEQYNEKVKNFSKVGAEEYVKFLQSSNFLTTLKTGSYDIVGFIKDYPVILNERAIDNRYRWLYQLNVMVTYIASGVSNYSNVKDSEYISKEYVVNLQLGRDRNVDNEHGVLIETWSAQAKK